MKCRFSRPLAAFAVAATAILLAGSCKKRSTLESDLDFGSGEHKWLGDAAFEQACGDAPGLCPDTKTLLRKDGKEAYSYGDLVAFSGDFFEKPNDIYDKSEKLLGRFSNKKYVMSHFEKQVQAINKMYHGDEEAIYPSNSVGVAVSIPQYGILALNNDVHFGWHNMVAYIEHHQAALDMAKEAHALRKTDAQTAHKKFIHALFLNAFADHFLTDAFAAGHIRVPRSQLKSWAADKRYTSSLSGTIAKVVHDFDGKLGKHFPKGLHVKNAVGHAWSSRVDAELFIRLDNDTNTVELPTQAVRMSLEEVFKAYETGTVPSGIFAAAQLVPYVDTSIEKGLGNRFQSLTPEEMEALVASKDWFSKVPYFTKVTVQHISLLSTDLPRLMDDFSAYVRTDVRNKPVITKRLPAAYIDYFSTIQ